MEIEGLTQPYALVGPGTVIKAGSVLTPLAKTAVKATGKYEKGLSEALGNEVASEDLDAQQTLLYQVLAPRSAA